MKRLIASNGIWYNSAKENIYRLSTSYDQLAQEQVLHMRVNNNSERYLSWEEHLNKISLIYVTWSFSIDESQNFSWDIDESKLISSQVNQVANATPCTYKVLLSMFWYPTSIGSDKVSDQGLRYPNGLCALPLWNNHFVPLLESLELLLSFSLLKWSCLSLGFLLLGQSLPRCPFWRQV
jgi:hypothetical protein